MKAFLHPCMLIFAASMAFLFQTTTSSAADTSLDRLNQHGEQVQRDLMARFNMRNDDCPSRNGARPAYLCSGVITRGAHRLGNDVNGIWEPDQYDLYRESLSMSFERQDTELNAGAMGNYRSGMIFHLPDRLPEGTRPLKLWCAYPVGGGTNTLSEHGCSGTATYRRCEQVGVETAEQWIADFETTNDQGNKKRCSFNMRPGFGDVASHFKAFMGAANHYHGLNELTVQPYASCQPDAIPIQAFYYTAAAKERGLAEARENQKDFYRATGGRILLPIIRIKRADSHEQMFSYLPTDQARLPDISPKALPFRCVPPRPWDPSAPHASKS